ncbi:MAG TPA: hypothetical protein PLP17_02020, partial [Oligoflexia bacterium]|nr:hypothetical protein [Oligoflexia bacterium]
MTNLRPLLGGARALSASFPDQTSSLNRQTSFNVPGPRAASVGPMAPRRDDAAVFTRMPDNFSEMPGYFAAGIERRHAEASRFAAEHAVDNAGGERFSLSMSHDEFSSEYIYLIASLDPEVQSGAKQLSDKVAEVEQAVMRTASPETPEASRAASVEQYAAISASEAMSVYFASDGWNAQLYAE